MTQPQVRAWAGALIALLILGCKPSKPPPERKAAPPRPVRERTPRNPNANVPAPDAKKVVMLYSSNLDGEYDDHPLGGLARRVTLARELRAKGPLLQVDAGDSLIGELDRGPKDPAPDPREIDRRANLMAAGLAKVGLDAFTPGERELLVLGPAKVAALAKKHKLPVVSANLLDKKGKTWFEPYRLIDIAGTRVGVFGINFLAFEEKDRAKAMGFTVGDPLGAAQGTVSVLREKGAQAVVGLFHVSEGPSDARQIARQIEGLDVQVLGHTAGKRNQRLRGGGKNIAFIEADRRGRLIGQLDIYVDEKTSKTLFRQEYHKLDGKVASDEETLALIKPYVEENKKRIARKQPVGLTARAGTRGELANANQEQWTYASNAACNLCHKEAQKHFLTTAHATAMDTLVNKGRDRDPECLRCHSTGFDRPGGTRNMATAASFFAGVGCESCHGPSAAHVRANNKTGTRRQVPESVCLECHTEKQSAVPLDYAAAMKEVLGPGHGR
jgi:2',3'-cyclic-nucleotide 2'-phosphodiesterase (5'-nucleotidase family)